MAKPTPSAAFATDANYTSDGDAWGGTATKVQPSAARQAEGAEPDTFAAQWFNYMMNAHGQWIEWMEDILDASDDILLDSRQLVIDPHRFMAHGAAGVEWYPTNPTGFYQSQANDGECFLALGRILPHGATLTRVEALVAPGAARATSGDRMELTMTKRTPDFATPSVGSASAVFTSVRDDGTVALQVLDSGAISETISSTTEYVISVIAGNDGGTNKDLFHALRLTFTDPGPRNF